jgi:putative FmdB family regulatory protein
MPIFEYVCKDCNSSFEKLVRGGDKPECPSCHGRHLTQKFSVFSASTPKSAIPVPRPMGGCCGGGACGLPGPCDN